MRSADRARNDTPLANDRRARAGACVRERRRTLEWEDPHSRWVRPLGGERDERQERAHRSRDGQRDFAAATAPRPRAPEHHRRLGRPRRRRGRRRVARDVLVAGRSRRRVPAVAAGMGARRFTPPPAVRSHRDRTAGRTGIRHRRQCQHHAPGLERDLQPAQR